MADNSEQLQKISGQIDVIIDLLRQKCAQLELPPTVDATRSGELPPDPTNMRELPPEQQKSTKTTRRESKPPPEKPNEVVKKSTPVDITKFSPKSLLNLAKAIRGDKKDDNLPPGGAKESNFIDNLLNTIGLPLLALAGGITALLAAANIDFGMFEGLTNLIGKRGFVGGLQVFIKAFAGKLTKKVLKRIPIIGSLISFKFAIDRMRDKDYIGAAVELASGIANLVPGVGSMLSLGLDVLNAYLDFKVAGSDNPTAEKTDIIKEMAAAAWEKIKLVIKDVPFVGSLFHIKDMIGYFGKKDTAGMVQGVMSLGMALANLIPGVNLWLSPALSFLRGMIDPSYAKNSLLGKGGAMMTDNTDWMEKIGEGVQEWFSNFLYSIVDMLPNIGGIKNKLFDKLGEWGFKQPSWIRRPDEPKYHVNKDGVRRKELTEDQISDLNVETQEAMLESGDISEFERQKLAGKKRKREYDPSKVNWSFGNRGGFGFTPTYTPSEPEKIEGRQDGGPVAVGKTYIVGEAGPEIIQPTQSGHVHSNDSIVAILQTNNEILTQLSQDIVTAVRETGTTINNANVANSTVNNTNAGSDITSFREQVKNTLYS